MKEGDLIGTKLNYVLVKRIESLDEFWEAIKENKLIYARHRLYATAFFNSWHLKHVHYWMSLGYFWTVKKIEL